MSQHRLLEPNNYDIKVVLSLKFTIIPINLYCFLLGKFDISYFRFLGSVKNTGQNSEFIRQKDVYINISLIGFLLVVLKDIFTGIHNIRHGTSLIELENRQVCKAKNSRITVNKCLSHFFNPLLNLIRLNTVHN